MSILFITPTYGGKVETPHFGSCLQLKEILTSAGVDHDWLLMKNESLVHRARMNAIRSYLEDTDWSVAMFLDADIEFDPGMVATIWNMLQDDDKEIAVGIYPMKKPDACWYAAWVDGKLIKSEDLDALPNPTAVDYAGTGFMAITRKAFEIVIEHLREKANVAQELAAKLCQDDLTENEKSLLKEMVGRMAADYEGPEGKRVPALFMTPIFNDILESEDYYFCRIAREAGLKIWLDPSIRLIHWGQRGFGA